MNQELALLAVSLTVAIATPARATPLVQSSSSASSLPNQVAQFPASCRRTSVQVPVGVRREPSFDSELVGTLLRGTRVSIENPGANAWVPISAPYKGYVYAGYLTDCGPSPTVPAANTNASTSPDPGPSSCRRATATNGLPIYSQAANTGPLVGTIANDQTITIVNLGRNGWVPISAPVEGYVSARYLTLCSQR